jgi:hypothetical protein
MTRMTPLLERNEQFAAAIATGHLTTTVDARYP